MSIMGTLDRAAQLEEEERFHHIEKLKQWDYYREARTYVQKRSKEVHDRRKLLKDWVAKAVLVQMSKKMIRDVDFINWQIKRQLTETRKAEFI
jgi:hypothetical protein